MGATGCEGQESKWYYFFISSIAAICFGPTVIFSYRFLVYLNSLRARRVITANRRISVNSQNNKTIDAITTPTSAVLESSWILEGRYWAGELISGQTRTGRILVVIAFLLSLASLGVYISEATIYPGRVEHCVPWIRDRFSQVDTAFNIFFLHYFWIRYFAAYDKLHFWVEMYSLIEHFTLPPCLLSIVLGRTWLGLRFLRALRIMTLPDVLQYLNIMKSGTAIRLCQLSTIFLSMWLSGAGAFHLLETSGSPVGNSSDGHNVFTYFDSLYFTIVTMSTVGFGDVHPTTNAGRLFCSIFILFALAGFASLMPEIADIIFSRSHYGGRYRPEHGKKHVVVCGHIDYDSANNFLKDFLHKDRNISNIDVVFLHRAKPGLRLQGVLKRHFTQVYYFQGTAMDSMDLKRAATDNADACLIISNRCCFNPDAEDAANIMRVISLKNFSPKLRVIVQLLQYHNKAYLLNIPNWSWLNGDNVVCIQELKLGFLAQSCMAPGFSTLLANLVSMRSYVEDPDDATWTNSYLRGSSMEIYSEYLSDGFVGLKFSEAAIICYSKLNVLLIAIESRDENSCSFLSINPGNSAVIGKNTQGFFICDSHEEVQRVRNYCRSCQSDISVKQLPIFKKCTCGNKNAPRHNRPNVVLQIENAKSPRSKRVSVDSQNGSVPVSIDNDERQTVHLNSILLDKDLLKLDLQNKSLSVPFLVTPSRGDLHKMKNVDNVSTSDGLFDLTGMFHWTRSVNFDEILLDKKEAERHCFVNHVIVCIFSEGTDSLIGLRNFVMPLRASNLHIEELQPIILVGDQDYLRREWSGLKHFSKVFVFTGCPMNRSLLRAAAIHRSSMCVILSSKATVRTEINSDPYLVDKEVLLCSLNIKSMQFSEALEDHQLSDTTGVRILTEIAVENNIQFLDQDDEDRPDSEIFQTQPFASGTAFAESVLDSLLSTAYYNHNAMTLIRTLITGGATPELEQLLAEGDEITGTDAIEELSNIRSRCRVRQISVQSTLFGDIWDHQSTPDYVRLFDFALNQHETLCLGLFRRQDYTLCNSYGEDGVKRFVMVNPPPLTQLMESDMVFCLQPLILNS